MEIKNDAWHLIIETDDLPKQICQMCAWQFENWRKFMRICKNSEALLRKKLAGDHSLRCDEEITWIHESARELKHELNQVAVACDLSETETEKTSQENHEIKFKSQDKNSETSSFKFSTHDDSLGGFSSGDEVPLLNASKVNPSEKEDSVYRIMRTVQTQAGSDSDNDDGESFVAFSCPKPAAVKWKSKKTQTGAMKKKLRVRPAVPSPCTLCEKVYKNAEILRQHMKSHHVTGVIRCSHCELDFPSLRSLKYHQGRKHSNLEPVPCSFCGKKFLDKKYLKIHENIHNEMNRFVCQFCGRSFVMKTNLTVHINRHHAEKSNDFICQMCGKAFPFKLYLKKHFKTHTEEKPHSCEHCNAKFREASLLRKHVNSIHLKLRPFICHYCNKTFTRNLYLREHMESQHLGLPRKAECQKCGQLLENRSRLRQHECTVP